MEILFRGIEFLDCGQSTLESSIWFYWENPFKNFSIQIPQIVGNRNTVFVCQQPTNLADDVIMSNNISNEQFSELVVKSLELLFPFKLDSMM